MELNKPKNQNAEVLYLLIKRIWITRLTVITDLGILNVTARIANLRIKYGIDVKCKKISTINKHGREIKYGAWFVENKENLIEQYNKINK